jgi:hypothetical protein
VSPAAEDEGLTGPVSRYRYRRSRFLSRVVATGNSGFAILEADVRNAATVTPIALRRVFAVRQRA